MLSICEAVALWLDGSDYRWLWKDACFVFPASCALMFGNIFHLPPLYTKPVPLLKQGSRTSVGMAGKELGTGSRTTASLNMWCDLCGGEM